MTEEVLVKVVVDCSTGESFTIPLTEEELEQREVDRIAYEEAEEARLAEESRIAAIKASAKTKLIAGQPLTEEEVSMLIV